MKQQKIIPLVMVTMIVASFISLGFSVGVQGGNLHAVKGAVYFKNNNPAPAGVSIFLEFPDENLSRTTYPFENGFNYVFNFPGHDGQTGTFSLYYDGVYHIPVANSTVLILKDVIGYHIDLHFDIEPSENQPPYIPSNPNPSDGEANVLINPHLSWTGGDPDGDPVVYDVYFGTSVPPALLETNLSETSYLVQNLNYSTLYYWRIVAWDNQSASTEGPLWEFTTQATPPQGGGGVTNIPPVADLSAGEPYRGIIGETLTFDGSRSYDPDGTIVSWQWTFGDGSTGAGNITTHMYTSVGSFDVTLRVTDNNGAQSTASTNAIITAPNLPPTDVLLQGPTKGQMNVTYTFVLSATDPEAGDLLYSVDWDDETPPSEGQLPHGSDALLNHTWMAAGVYQIEAWVQDDQNARTYVSHRILINVEYVGDFGYLIDHDNDGIYDALYSNMTMSETEVELQDDGTYYLDVDGDGVWDHIYDPVTKQLTPFPTPDGEQDFSAFLLLGGIIAFIVILLALLLRIRKK